MLELIFQGFMEWAYGLTLECWQYFSSALLDLMSMDFAYLKTHVPVIDDIMQVLMAVGWALLIGNLVFQALKSMASGLGFEGEDPKLLFTRTFVFSFLLLTSPQICDIGLSMTSRIIDLLQIPNAVNVQLVDESVFGSLTAAWLLVIIFGVIIMFKVFKLLLEIAERYVILAMLTITAPLAFSMGGSKSTSEIFTGWCRMFGSMCLLMVTNVIFFKMLLSVLSTVPSGLDVLPWMVLILTIVKVARKADAIVTRIGLNPAITGDSLGRVFPGALTYMVMRTAASQITKAVGKNAGSSGKGTGGVGRGKSPGTPPGGSGGPRMGGPVGGRSGGAGSVSYAQQSTSQQTTTQQNTSQQSGSQQTATHQGTAYQSSTTQAGSQQSTTQEHTTSSMYQGGSQVGQTARPGAQSRKSSVPPGTRRSPTHVKSASSTPPVGAQSVAGRPGAAGRAVAAAGVAGMAGAAAASQIRNGAASPVQPASAAVQHGAAGTPAAPSPSRMTQVNTQKVQGGPVTGTTQAAERTGITVGQTAQNTTSVSTQTPSAGVKGAPSAPVAAGGQQTQARPADTRFSQRPAQSVPKAAPVSQAGASVTRQTTVHTEGTQHGPAGKPPTASAQQAVKEPRPGRNFASASTAAPTEARQHSPTRQEPRPASASSMPTVKSSAPGLHPGPAGTATGGHQTTQARQTARSTASVPSATGSQGGKKAVSNTKAAVKGHADTSSASQPTRKQRGKKT